MKTLAVIGFMLFQTVAASPTRDLLGLLKQVSKFELPADCTATLRRDLNDKGNHGIHFFTLKQDEKEITAIINIYQRADAVESATDVHFIYYQDNPHGGLIDFHLIVSKEPKILRLKLNEITCE